MLPVFRHFSGVSSKEVLRLNSFLGKSDRAKPFLYCLRYVINSDR